MTKEEAIKTLRELLRETNDHWYEETYSMAIEALEQMSSANVQSVVRCENCKHSTEWYRDKRRCFLWSEDGIDVFEDGYCNYWDRKDSEQNDTD